MELEILCKYAALWLGLLGCVVLLVAIQKSEGCSSTIFHCLIMAFVWYPMVVTTWSAEPYISCGIRILPALLVIVVGAVFLCKRLKKVEDSAPNGGNGKSPSKKLVK